MIDGMVGLIERAAGATADRRRDGPRRDASPDDGAPAPALPVPAAAARASTCEMTILMPCLNEARTLAACIGKARAFLDASGINGEVLVADNGSTDGSVEIARRCGARVVAVSSRGYGNALIAGIDAARGRYVAMGDADDSYDFGTLGPFVARLREGYDLVMGNRFEGGIGAGAMPALHRYLGNPVLSLIGRVLFRVPIGDFHCGLRAFRRDAIRSLALSEPGMEFASELVVKAALRRLRICEVPTTLVKDGRDRAPHLRSWRDGWRHLRFLLALSPRWLFLYPGLVFLIAGWATQLVLYPGALRVGAIGFDIHTMVFGAASALIGVQLCVVALLARCAGISSGLLPDSGPAARLFDAFRLESVLVVAIPMLVAAAGLALHAAGAWSDTGFSAMRPGEMLRPIVLSLTLAVSAIEIVAGAFFMRLLQYAADGSRGRRRG
ncbi:MAG: glycosyltransferase family 2 protein [Lautropia sp.]